MVPRPGLVTGAVLAGGRSRRFGSDKALYQVGGRAMVVRVADALRIGGATRVVVVGGDSPAFAALDLDTVEDRWPDAGPLGGLLTALGAPVVPTVVAAAGAVDAVVVAACDLPFVDGPTVAALLAALRTTAAAAAVADPGRLQPLLGAWRAGLVEPVLAAAFAAGARSMDEALAALAVAGLAVVPVPVAAGLLRNVNHRSDLGG